MPVFREHPEDILLADFRRALCEKMQSRRIRGISPKPDCLCNTMAGEISANWKNAMERAVVIAPGVYSSNLPTLLETRLPPLLHRQLSRASSSEETAHLNAFEQADGNITETQSSRREFNYLHRLIRTSICAWP